MRANFEVPSPYTFDLVSLSGSLMLSSFLYGNDIALEKERCYILKVQNTAIGNSY